MSLGDNDQLTSLCAEPSEVSLFGQTKKFINDVEHICATEPASTSHNLGHSGPGLLFLAPAFGGQNWLHCVAWPLQRKGKSPNRHHDELASEPFRDKSSGRWRIAGSDPINVGLPPQRYRGLRVTNSIVLQCEEVGVLGCARPCIVDPRTRSSYCWGPKCRLVK